MNKRKIVAEILLGGMILLSGCGSNPSGLPKDSESSLNDSMSIQNNDNTPEIPGDVNTALSDSTPVESLLKEETQEKLYAGYQETETDISSVSIICTSGSKECYTIEGNTLTFTGVSEDSIYVISGTFTGNIIIDVGEEYKFELEMQGLTVTSNTTSPILIKSGDKVTLTAKKGYQNYIYDMRDALNEEDTSEKSGAVYAETDLEISGKGELIVVSKNNNGIHAKKDLDVKNLTLMVQCVDNALKGNDSVTLKNAVATLIAIKGDGIKTVKTDISSKGKQRGIISVHGGTYTIYAACDGMDAAYDVIIEDSEEQTAVISIYTDKYSEYSEAVEALGETSDVVSGASAMMPKNDTSEMPQDVPDGMPGSIPNAPDGFPGGASGNVPGNNGDGGDFENKGGFRDRGDIGNKGNFGDRGGFGNKGGIFEGNSDKSEYSAKGIKASNEVIVNGGTINIKSYDDAIHADNDATLENGEAPKGNVAVNGGTLTLYSDDDGIHADGTAYIKNGTVTVSNSYEGVEGNTVEISGGSLSVVASDDGINATATTGTGITVSGGNVYVCCTGDGFDSNSRTSYEGIVFSGGKTVIISNSTMNSSIDSERGYRYENGSVLAIMPSRGMTQEVLQCQNFSSVGTKTTASLTADRFLTVTTDKTDAVTVKMPMGIAAMITYLGSKNAEISVTETTSAVLNSNGVCWY